MNVDEIRDKVRQHFGLDLERAINRLDKLAGRAMRMERVSNFADRGRVTMDDADFALIAFFAGIGRQTVIDMAPTPEQPKALPSGNGGTVALERCFSLGYTRVRDILNRTVGLEIDDATRESYRRRVAFVLRQYDCEVDVSSISWSSRPPENKPIACLSLSRKGVGMDVDVELSVQKRE